MRHDTHESKQNVMTLFVRYHHIMCSKFQRFFYCCCLFLFAAIAAPLRGLVVYLGYLSCHWDLTAFRIPEFMFETSGFRVFVFDIRAGGPDFHVDRTVFRMFVGEDFLLIT